MSMLNDYQIAGLCKERFGYGTLTHPMITPFIGHKVTHNVTTEPDTLGSESSVEVEVPCLSYGLDSFGYDIRMNPEGIRMLDEGRLVDPFNLDERAFPFVHPHRIGENKFGKYIDLYQGEAILGKSIEHFRIPPNIKVLCLGKSTYARMAVANLTTPLEAGWTGYLTIEIVAVSSAAVRVYLGNHGIVSLMFFHGAQSNTTYGDGKYQDQGNEVVLPRAYSPKEELFDNLQIQGGDDEF